MSDASYFPNSIAITSQTGVGSSTTVKHLAKLLPPLTRVVSGGGIQRGLAAGRGMTIEAWSAYCKEHPEEGIDKKVEALLAQYGTQNHLLLESRLAHIAVPRGFKVLLRCDVDIRAARRASGEQRHFEEVRAAIIKRDTDDESRYRLLYGDDVIWPESKFDLVVDTGNDANTPDQVAAIIVDAHGKWVERNREHMMDEWTVSA